MSDLIKKLTGKNQQDYSYAAKYIMDNSDQSLFAELVEKDSFLFDFVKENVAKRLFDATNDMNWKSVLSFMKFYSPSYENFIVSTLVKYADEDLTDEILEMFENGGIDEKIYSARFFSYVQDPLSIPLLKKYAYDEDDYLCANCAFSLKTMGETSSYNEALDKLKSDDDFEKLSAVRFLVAYGNKVALPAIISAMKQSALSENIAGQIPYLESILNIIDDDFENGLLVINQIVNGLGEILSLSQVFDYQLYEAFDYILTRIYDSRVATIILNAQEKFDILTENDEYLFDEDKNTKQEIFEIKHLLSSVDKKALHKAIVKELREDSQFVYTALEFTDDLGAIRELLKCNNQTIILKTAEVLKSFGNLDDTAKTVALLKITDENIKSIIRAL